MCIRTHRYTNTHRSLFIWSPLQIKLYSFVHICLQYISSISDSLHREQRVEKGSHVPHELLHVTRDKRGESKWSTLTAGVHVTCSVVLDAFQQEEVLHESNVTINNKAQPVYFLFQQPLFSLWDSWLCVAISSKGPFVSLAACFDPLCNSICDSSCCMTLPLRYLHPPDSIHLLPVTRWSPLADEHRYSNVCMYPAGIHGWM